MQGMFYSRAAIDSKTTKPLPAGVCSDSKPTDKCQYRILSVTVSDNCMIKNPISYHFD